MAFYDILDIINDIIDKLCRKPEGLLFVSDQVICLK